MTPERAYTTVDDYRVHSIAAGAGPPVLLVHGLSGSHRWWRFTLPALGERHRVHVPELIGFGASRPTDRCPDIPEMAEVLMRWMDARKIERPRLVGHSMGGQICIHMAARWPERFPQLVLAGAAGIPRSRSLADIGRLFSELLPPRAWGRLTFLPVIAMDAIRAGPRILLQAVDHILADDVRPLLPGISAPTLLVWGELDALVPLEHGRIMEEAIPDARLAILRDAAHNPMADRPARFNRIILDFLDAA